VESKAKWQWSREYKRIARPTPFDTSISERLSQQAVWLRRRNGDTMDTGGGTIEPTHPYRVIEHKRGT